ncbi:Transmembrane protein [Balamuthia mandrillaris]
MAMREGMASCNPLTLALFFSLWSVLLCSAYAELTPISEDEALTVFKLSGLHVRVVNNSGPSMFVFPALPSGEVLEDYWFYFSLGYLKERKCTGVDGRSLLTGCSGVEPFFFNLTDPQNYEIMESRENYLRLRWNGLGGPFAVSEFILEGIQHAENRTFMNGKGTEKVLHIPASSAKFSLVFSNFTSHVLSPGEHFFDGTDGVFTEFNVRTFMGVSSLIIPSPYLWYYNPVVPDLSTVGDDKLITYINTIQNFQVRVGQAAFSVNEPPTASLVHQPEELWGFEIMDASIENWDKSLSAPHASEFEFDVVMIGGREVLYDPDISLLFPGGDDGEDGEDGTTEDGVTDEGQKEDDDDSDKAVIIAVAVVVPVVMLVVVVGTVAAVIVRNMRQKKSRDKIEKQLSGLADQSQVSTAMAEE